MTDETHTDDHVSDESTPVMTTETAPDPAQSPIAIEGVSADNPVWAVGRRKSSTARVRLFPGNGTVSINGKALDEFFRLEQDRRSAMAPLTHLGIAGEYDIHVNVRGGGTTGQAGAVSLGIARAMVKYRPGTDPTLRHSGLLTRDARVKERKKYGRRGARRGFQFSKR